MSDSYDLKSVQTTTTSERGIPEQVTALPGSSKRRSLGANVNYYTAVDRNVKSLLQTDGLFALPYLSFRSSLLEWSI